jgi:transposase-like protein
MRNPFRYFNSSLEIIRLAVLMSVRYPLSLRQVEDLLFERGIDISHETARSQSNVEISEARAVALWRANGRRDGSTSVIPCCDE